MVIHTSLEQFQFPIIDPLPSLCSPEAQTYDLSGIYVYAPTGSGFRVIYATAS